MFNASRNKKKNRKKHTVDTLITETTVISGDITFSGNLYVDGTVDGDLNSDDEAAILTIGPKGHIQGHIRVPHVIVYGQVTGNIDATGEVELMNSAIVNGDVQYQMLQMAMGATVNGKLIKCDPTEIHRLEHRPETSDKDPIDRG